jgi:hypothetical protein
MPHQTVSDNFVRDGGPGEGLNNIDDYFLVKMESWGGESSPSISVSRGGFNTQATFVRGFLVSSLHLLV